MKRGVIVLSVIISLVLSTITPFFIEASTYDIDYDYFNIPIWQISAYEYFINHGFKNFTFSNNQNKAETQSIGFDSTTLTTTYDLSSLVPRFTMEIPQHSLSTLFTQYMNNSNYDFRVYRGGNFLGYFAGFGVNGGLMYYSGTEARVTCQPTSADACYLKINDLDPTSSISYTLNITENVQYINTPSFIIEVTGSSSTSLSGLEGLLFSQHYFENNQIYSTGNINGTFTPYTSYNYLDGTFLSSGKTYVFSYMYDISQGGISSNTSDHVLDFFSNSSTSDISYSVSNTIYNGYRIFRYHIVNNGTSGIYFTFNDRALNNKTFSCIPLYYGLKEQMPDDIYSFLFNSRLEDVKTKQDTQITNQETQITNQETIITRLGTIITNITTGGSKEQSSANTADSVNSSSNQVFNNAHQQEETALNNMNSNLESLNPGSANNSLFGNTKFIWSARWVKNQFENMTISNGASNAFGMLITFSLIIGVALTIVGKLRT